MSSSSHRPSATIPDPRYHIADVGDGDEDITYLPHHIPLIDLCYNTPEKPPNARRRVQPSSTTEADANDISIVDLCSLDDTIIDVDAQQTPASRPQTSMMATSKASTKPIMPLVQGQPTTIQTGVIPGTCAICLNEFGNETSATATRCGHVFCTPCITKAVMLNKKCPLCNNAQSKQHLLRLFVSNN